MDRSHDGREHQGAAMQRELREMRAVLAEARDALDVAVSFSEKSIAPSTDVRARWQQTLSRIDDYLGDAYADEDTGVFGIPRRT